MPQLSGRVMLWQATTAWTPETWQATIDWTDDMWQATAQLDSTGDEILFGTIGNDNLSGNAGKDILDGLAANDLLDGGEGDDIIKGSGGNDTLTGGTGSDSFVFESPTEGIDTIEDFDSSEGDRIVISATGFGGGLTPDGVLADSQFVLGKTAVDSVDILAAVKRTAIPKPHDLGFCFFPLRGSAPAAPVLLCSGLMVANRTDTASPAAKIFLLALISRSW